MNVSSVCTYKNELSSGAFSRVYAFGKDRIVMRAKDPDSDDGKYTYLKRCAERLKKYGLHSEEMVGLPEVYQVFKDKTGRWVAEMKRYHKTWRCVEPEQRGSLDEYTSYAYAALVMKAHKLTVDTDDAHGGNLMYCPLRKQMVVIDPTTSEDLTEDKMKRKAQWKQRRYH